MGTVALVFLARFGPRKDSLSRGCEKLGDELDLAFDPCLFVIDVAAFDSPDRLDPAQGCLGRSQGSKALTVAKEAFHGRMIALDQIVAPLSVDMPDTVEMRIIAMVDLANDPGVGRGFVCHNDDRPMQAHPLNRLVQKGLCRLRIPSCGKTEVDHLPVRIDGTPQVAPLAADADIGFIDMPVDAGSAQVFLGPFCDLRTKLLNPAIHGRPVNGDPALCEQVNDILIGQRVAQIPPYRAKDDLARKTVMLEW